ncbi:MAG TPA: GTP cyclohydrolase I, partial [Anaerolineales bacterium]|nr:GTP cyclohydrolase I [Anaerolineales bacterium]
MELDEKRLLELAHLLPDDSVDQAAIQQVAKQMLSAFGEDPEREGLLRTPGRVARMYEELLAGYRVDPIA